MSRWTNWLSRHPFTMKITGSNPVRDTFSLLAQLEEHLPYMQGVVGSIPTGTTKNDKVGSKTRPNSEVMKYIFRGHTVFEYKPDDKFDKVVQGQIHGAIPAFDFCKMIDEDYKLLGEFFNTVYRHTQGEDVPLEDIEVY